MTSPGYVLQCEIIHFHSDCPSDFETIVYYKSSEISDIPDVRLAVHEYLVSEYGEDYKTAVFDSVDTTLDKDHIGGYIIEATDMEGDILRFWLQMVK